MELKNEPNVKQDHRLLKIVIVSALITGILAISFFIISNLGPSQNTLAATVTRYAVANGNWNSTSTWSASSGGSSGASIPVAGDIVYIGEGNTALTVTIPSGYTANCTTLYLGSNSYNKANSLTLASSSSVLNVSGNFVFNRPSGSNITAVNVGDGTATVGGNCNFIGTSTTTDRDLKIDINAGSLSIEGDFNIDEGVTGNNLVDMAGGAGTLSIGGDFDPVKTDFIQGTSTVVYDGIVAQTIRFFPSDAYYNLKITNTHASGATLSAAITTSKLSSNLTIGNGTSASKFSTANYNIALNTLKTFKVEENAEIASGTSVITFGIGCFAIINGTFNTTNTNGFSGQTNTAINSSNMPIMTLGNNSNIKYSASGTQTINTRTDYQDLSITGGSKTIASGSITINDDFSIATGATYSASANDPILTIKGDFTNNGTFTSGSGEVRINGTVPQTIGGSSSLSFENLEIINSSTTEPQVTLGQNITITTNLELTDGIVAIGNYNIVMASGSALNDGDILSFVLTTGTGVFKWMSCAKNTSKLFPVGHSPSTKGYAPLQIDFNEAHTTDDYSVRIDSVLTNNGTKNGTPVTSKIVNCTWQISEGTSGGSNIDLNFNWASCRLKSINTNYAMQLLHYTSNTWQKPSNKKNKISYLLNSMCGARFEGYTGTFSPFGVGEGDGSVGLIFDGSPSVSGTPGAVGTKYTWNNVGTVDSTSTNIKAVIEIISKTGGAVLQNIDQSSTGSVNAWQPIVNGSQSNGSCWGMEFRIRFYISGTNTRLTLTGCKAQGIDIDGDNQYIREYNRFDKPASYAVETNTVLTITNSSSNYTFKGPTTNVEGIDVTQTNYAVSCTYQNTDSINLVLGGCCSGGSCATIDGNRLHSINFFDVVPYTAPLPVKMVYFNGKVSGSTSALTWATSSEINNSHFEVQRSTDNKEWTNIGRVEGNGNSSQLIKYEFIDEQPLVSNYYRLKQMDFDGRFEYSSVRFVDFKTSAKAGIACVVFPNPTNGLFNLEISKKNKINKVQIDIMDIQGSLVKQMDLDADGTQYFLTSIDISSFSNGIYLVRVTSGENVQTIKLRKK
ncbi:MAG: T9SS type A sorting domain-containing protein [Bacteroidia bacterium]